MVPNSPSGRDNRSLQSFGSVQPGSQLGNENLGSAMLPFNIPRTGLLKSLRENRISTNIGSNSYSSLSKEDKPSYLVNLIRNNPTRFRV
jgi:hypothetical protein